MVEKLTHSELNQKHGAQSFSSRVFYIVVILPIFIVWGTFLGVAYATYFATGETTDKPTDDIAPPKVVEQPKARGSENVLQFSKPKRDPNYVNVEKTFVLGLQQKELRLRLEEAESGIEDLQEEISAFNSTVNELFTNESGRRLASEKLAQKFDYLRQYPNASSYSSAAKVVSDVKSRIQSVSEPISQFPALLSELTSAHIQVQAVLRQYKDASSAIDAELNNSHQTYDQTLADALSQLGQRREEFRNQQVDKRLREERQRQDEMLSNEKERLLRLESELQAAKRERNQTIERSRTAVAKTRASESRAQKRIVDREQQKLAAMQAAYPAVRQLLLPFTTKGYAQPERSRRRMQRTSESKPISYSTLLGCGALDDSRAAREKLFHLVQPKAVFGPPNDRPLGEFPAYHNHYDFDNAANQSKIQKAQAFLREHGESMVSQGLLSK